MNVIPAVNPPYILTDMLIGCRSLFVRRHFSIQSWLFKNRFKTKEGLLRTSYLHHLCLTTGI